MATATPFLLELPGQQRAPEAPSLLAQLLREGEHVVTTLPPKPVTFVPQRWRRPLSLATAWPQSP